jgi:hypothetical protein
MSANAETAIMRKAKFKIQERKPNFSVSSPPGCIDKRVFIGGNYALMPILREIEKTVLDAGFQPILAYDFDMPKEKTREYTLRLLFQCKYAVLEETLSGGQIVETARASGFQQINILQVFMAMDERKEPPSTVSIMVWQTNPAPQGYCTISELRELVQSFLLQY